MTTDNSLFQHDAQLMWTPETADTTANVYVYFRSHLKLDCINGSAILRIYAKDIYELYINEQDGGFNASATILVYCSIL